MSFELSGAMMKTMLHASIDERDRFLRKEIERGRSGRLIVHELVRLGYCDADKARDLVSRAGPAVYASLSRRYGALFTVGMVLLMTMVLALFTPNSPIQSGQFFGISMILGPILTAIGWAGVHRYKTWAFQVDEVDGRESRLEGLAREMLGRGKGEWAIVHEAGRLGLGDPDAARAAVARAWPDIYREFAGRRRSVLMIGVLVLGIGLAPLFVTILAKLFGDYRSFSFGDLGALIFLMSIPIAIGSALVAYGWAGARRRNDQSIGLPGSTQSGPVRTGLEWNAGPFERQ